MKVLVDTHAFFWWVNESSLLSRNARRIVESADNTVLISVVVGWELATKARIGKWDDAIGLANDIDAVLERNGFAPLPITMEHARVAGFLPGRHRDPFDRMLAAQSQIEGAPLITADPVFRAFGTAVLW